MTRTAIVTLTRFPEIFTAFARSVEQYEPTARRIVINSGKNQIGRSGWEEANGPEPFVWARNANLGIDIAGDDDVLLVNDDVQFLSPVISTLAGICEDNPEIGVVSPQVIGGINNPQADAKVKISSPWIESRSPLLPFVCVYLPRWVFDQVGSLDESFIGYGGDDEDWCLRARKAGFKLAITPLVRVRHGFGPHEYSSSFFRTMTPAQRQESLEWSRNRVSELHPIIR